MIIEDSWLAGSYKGYGIIQEHSRTFFDKFVQQIAAKYAKLSYSHTHLQRGLIF